MAILVVCSGCKKSFNVDDKFAGKTGACPKCKAKITVPEKAPEVTVHAPDEFSGGGKGVSGKLLLKPIERQEARVKPVAAAVIGGVAAAAVAWAFAVRSIDPENSMLRYLVSGAGLLLVSPPLAIAAYTFLRDPDAEPYRGKTLFIRAGACGLVYTVLWGIFVYLRTQLGTPIELMYWVFVAPPFLIVGGLAGKFSLDLETSNGYFHYAFYVAVTMLLEWIAHLPMVWQ